MSFNVKDYDDPWMLPLELRSNLDGSGAIYLLHGNKPVIAVLDTNGYVEGFMNKNKVIREALCAELSVLEKIERGLKSPKDLASVSLEQIENLAAQYQGVDAKDFVSTELLFGLIIHDSSFSSFPSAEKRIDSIDFGKLVEDGVRAERYATKKKFEKDFEPTDIERE